MLRPAVDVPTFWPTRFPDVYILHWLGTFPVVLQRLLIDAIFRLLNPFNTLGAPSAYISRILNITAFYYYPHAMCEGKDHRTEVLLGALALLTVYNPGTRPTSYQTRICVCVSVYLWVCV